MVKCFGKKPTLTVKGGRGYLLVCMKDPVKTLVWISGLPGCKTLKKHCSQQKI